MTDPLAEVRTALERLESSGNIYAIQGFTYSRKEDAEILRRHLISAQHKQPEYDSRPDGTGLDDGPKLPFSVIMQTKKPLIIKAWQEGLSARACARVFDVSHEMAAQCVKGLSRKAGYIVLKGGERS